MASFYAIRGKDSGQHFLVRGAMSRIGRDANSPIRLNDTEVSRQHALVIRDAQGEHEIVDNSSSNGTFVNSRRITRQLLRSGDRVQVGRTLMIYTGGPEPHDSSSSHDKVSKSRAQEAVEIVAGAGAQELSHITRSLESQFTAGVSSVGSNSGIKAKGESLNASVAPPNSGGTQANEWEIVYNVSQAVSRTLDLQDLLEQILELIFQWIGCDRGCLMLLDEVTGQLTPTCTRDRRSEISSAAKVQGDAASSETAPRRIKISRTILDHVLETKEGVLTSNAQDDARWENVESIASIGVHEAICVPLLGRYGLVGVIYVDTTMSAGAFAERHGKSCFDEQHLKLLLAISGQAALAIEDTQFYQAVLQSERLAAMGQTIANLSHHVKNILQGVRGGSYLVEDGIKKSDLAVVRQGWGIVQRNQDRISNLVMDMLSFSKEREPELVVGDLVQLLTDIVDLMAARAAELDVELLFDKPDGALEAEFDAEAMHRAVLNVVTNALDAAGEQDGEGAERRVAVSVGYDVATNRVNIDVQDTGEGISDDDKERIFAPFESSKGSRGTGLGLPVSKKILIEHGGDISVRSELGTGTTFSLIWPALQTASPDQTVETLD